ncbi:MAG: c-type cytochrome [Pirellulales bacterium]|nr:c-type cytochrome [Pirellulales bacterium]
MADDPQAQQDATIIETLLRLENFDLESSAKGKAAVERFLEREPGSDRFFELIEKFKIKSAAPDLVELAAEKSGETAGVRAVQLLLKLGQGDVLKDVINGEDAEKAAGVVKSLGLSGDTAAVEVLAPLLTDTKRALAVRSAAARAIGRSTTGQRQLLALVASGKLPDDLDFTAADVLLSARDENIRKEASQHLKLPESSGAAPLPPLAELVQRNGNAANGHTIFKTKGTCSKCHQVGAEGKNVGPALTEIGSKLAKEAMYLAILDPSAAISHNYESYLVVTVTGKTAVGLLISETDDAVTIRTAEGIDQTFKMDDVDELIKQKTSIMPTGLQKLMTADELVDLVAYLQSLKKK